MTAPSSPIPGELEKSTYIEHETGKRISRNYLSKMFEEKFHGTKGVKNERFDDFMKRTTYYVFKPEVIAGLIEKYNI